MYFVFVPVTVVDYYYYELHSADAVAVNDLMSVVVVVVGAGLVAKVVAFEVEFLGRL